MDKVCFYCKCKFKFDYSYVKHLNTCRLSLNKNPQEDNIKEDENVVIDEILTYCALCNDLSFNDTNSYLLHFEREHSSVNNNQPNLKYKCHLCSSQCENTEDFQEHMKTHCNDLFNLHEDDNEKKIKSLFEVLGKTTVNEEDENLNYSKKVLIECCAEIVRKRQEALTNGFENELLRQDKALLSENEIDPDLLGSNSKESFVMESDACFAKVYECKTCNKTFKKSNDLLRHTRVHSNERPFKCNHCPKAFKLKCVLETHLKTHLKSTSNENRPYCEVCNAKFSCKGALNVHMRIHTGYKPYKCELCTTEEKCFRTSSEYRSHMFHEHSIKIKKSRNDLQGSDKLMQVDADNLFETLSTADNCTSGLNDFENELNELLDFSAHVCVNAPAKNLTNNIYLNNSQSSSNEISGYSTKTCELDENLFLNNEDYLSHF